MIKNYYLDILDEYMDVDLFSKALVNIDRTSCFLPKGYHRCYYKKFGRHNFSSKILIKQSFDVKYIESKKQIDSQSNNRFDYFEITKIDRKYVKVKKTKKTKIVIVLY